MKLTWSFFESGDAVIPVSHLKAVRSKKKAAPLAVNDAVESNEASTAIEGNEASPIAAGLETTDTEAPQPKVLSVEEVATVLKETAEPSSKQEGQSSTQWAPSSPFSDFMDGFDCLEDWANSLSLSGESVSEAKGGSVFVADPNVVKDRFHKVWALGFSHEDAFTLEPLTDGQSITLRATGAFSILSAFTMPQLLEVQSFEKHDPWKIAIVLSCLVHCYVRSRFEQSVFHSWLAPTFERVDPLKICVNKKLLSDAKSFADVLFDQFCAVAK
jgi:hypothetical protein